MKNCKGMNCAEYEDGYHSPECRAEHAAAVAGGEFFKLEACSEKTRARRERWLENIRAAIACGLPKNLVRNLNNTANEIERSIKYGGTKELRAEVARLRATATATPLPPSVGGEPVQRFWCHEARNIRCVREADYDALSAQLAWSRAGECTAIVAMSLADDALKGATDKLAASQARVAELETSKSLLLELLKEHEWQYRPYDETYHQESGYRCPDCGEYRENGHTLSCGIGAAMAQKVTKPNETPCKECGARGCNGECYGDDMMGDS